jgi:AcrR family transcriptional regulator
MSPAPKKRLSRQDWIASAIVMGAEAGFDKISVEALAIRVGATRGSFYWHFTDRADLIAAVLSEWETRATVQTIELLDQLPADEAMQALIATAFGATTQQDSAEWRLIIAADDPLIGPVVARVHRLRVSFIERLLVKKGLAARDASEQARVAYAAYLGAIMLQQFESDGANLGPALLRLLD